MNIAGYIARPDSESGFAGGISGFHHVRSARCQHNRGAPVFHQFSGTRNSHLVKALNQSWRGSQLLCRPNHDCCSFQTTLDAFWMRCADNGIARFDGRNNLVYHGRCRIRHRDQRRNNPIGSPTATILVTSSRHRMPRVFMFRNQSATDSELKRFLIRLSSTLPQPVSSTASSARRLGLRLNCQSHRINNRINILPFKEAKLQVSFPRRVGRLSGVRYGLKIIFQLLHPPCQGFHDSSCFIAVVRSNAHRFQSAPCHCDIATQKRTGQSDKRIGS